MSVVTPESADPSAWREACSWTAQLVGYRAGGDTNTCGKPYRSRDERQDERTETVYQSARVEIDRVLLAVATKVETTLPAWSIRQIFELDANDRRAQHLAAGLSSDQLNWKPGQDAWSIGQCLHYLLLFNEVYLPAISNSLDGRQRSRVQDIAPGWFGRWFIRNYVEPSFKSRRARAPRKIAPGERIEPTILDSFLRSNQEARELVRRASDCDVNRILFKNPLIPLLRFTVGTGLEIVWKHQCRHLLQAERVKQSADFPKE
jgi:hypothetical protein